MKRKTITSIVFAFAVLVIAGSGSSVSAQEKKVNAKLAKQANITMEQAGEIASKRIAGTIEESELEKEHGKIVYSFDIRTADGKVSEVQVDAKTGEIVRIEEEDAKAEAKEKSKKHK